MNEHDASREQEIVERARELYAESVRNLDGETRSRLARARVNAVEAAGSRPNALRYASSRLVPIGGLVAAVLTVALIWPTPRSPVELDGAGMAGDLDILLEGESLDLFEDLEFYAWLLEQPELLEAGEAGDGSG